jgi:hypothetical protein
VSLNIQPVVVSRCATRGFASARLQLAAFRLTPRKKPGDGYVYFDNDGKVPAPFGALELIKRLFRTFPLVDARDLPQ